MKGREKMLKNNLYSPEIIPLSTQPDKTIIIPLDEYKELLFIKGKYEELKSKPISTHLPKKMTRLYVCDPTVNISCPKNNCSYNGGVCKYTTNKKYKKKQTLNLGSIVKTYQDNYSAEYRIIEKLFLRNGDKAYKLDNFDTWFKEDDLILVKNATKNSKKYRQ